MRYQRSASLIAIAITLVACAPDEPPVEPAARIVETLEVSSGSAVASRTFIGELRAADRADLSFEVGGIITQLPFDLGDRFDRGDVLGRVDRTTAQLALDAALAERRAAEAQLADARLDFERLDGLDGTGAVSKSAVDGARTRLESAEAQVAAIAAQVSTARERLADTRLIAPFDGEVAERLVEPSQVVQPGQAVYRITGRDAGVEVIMSVPERLLSLFEIGLQSDIVLKPSNLIAQARVSEIGQSANQSGLYPVTLAVIDGPQDRLRPGLRVEVAQYVREQDAVVTAPLSALLAGHQKQGYLFVVDPQTSRVEQRAVDIGSVDQAGVVILSGVQPGERIVTKGVALLKDGERVTPAGVGVARYN